MTALTPDENGLRRRPDQELYDKGNDRMFTPGREYNITTGWEPLTLANGRKIMLFFLTFREGGMSYTLPFENSAQALAIMEGIIDDIKHPKTQGGLFVPPGA